ncbi:hypothetical protein MMC22_006401 [Lobaria immixta]|nr:hypothetical protein [Lobaria immixta]
MALSVVPVPSLLFLLSVSAISTPSTVPAAVPLLTSSSSDVPTTSTGLPSGGTPSLPSPPAVPASLIPNLSSAVIILQFIIALLQQTISAGGVPVAGVAGIGVGVGTNLLPILLASVGGLISKAGLTIPAV